VGPSPPTRAKPQHDSCGSGLAHGALVDGGVDGEVDVVIGQVLMGEVEEANVVFLLANLLYTQ